MWSLTDLKTMKMNQYNKPKTTMNSVSWTHQIGARLWKKSGKNFQNFCDLIEKQAGFIKYNTGSKKKKGVRVV